jgi:hypothetical protein
MTHWWFDWPTQSFWPMTYPVLHEPQAILEFTASTGEDSAVMLGGRDGYIRRFRDTADNDDGTAFTSYLLYGPIKMGDSYRDGMFSELGVTLGGKSGPVTLTTLTGSTEEESVYASAFSTHSVPLSGLNYRVRPRVRGDAICLKIAGTASRPWSIESLVGVRLTLGTHRKE